MKESSRSTDVQTGTQRINMASKDFEKNLTITANPDNGPDNNYECAVCGKDNADKKCRKRHGGCDNKRFCSRDCDTLGHVKKEKAVEEKEAKEKVVETIDDAAIVKMRKKEARKTRKQAKKDNVMCGCCTGKYLHA